SRKTAVQKTILSKENDSEKDSFSTLAKSLGKRWFIRVLKLPLVCCFGLWKKIGLKRRTYTLFLISSRRKSVQVRILNPIN
ncbi:MAG: hypothetical protein PHR69_11300, partial [Sphaerochaeta sp.]|nr:hypothetical protein [Sphaerochaeta sp.]